MWENKYWTYKGHKCVIEHDHEEDCVKAFHWITQPDGTQILADLTPYDSSKELVECWIDAGYPGRYGVGPLHREDFVVCPHCLHTTMIPEARQKELNVLGFSCPECQNRIK